MVYLAGSFKKVEKGKIEISQGNKRLVYPKPEGFIILISCKPDLKTRKGQKKLNEFACTSCEKPMALQRI